MTLSTTHGGKWEKLVVIKWTPRDAPRISVFVGRTPNNSSQSACQPVSIEPMTRWPCTRNPNKMTTSYNVMVISPTSMWNVCVSRCHLSTNAVIKGQSTLTWPTRWKTWNRDCIMYGRTRSSKTHSRRILCRQVKHCPYLDQHEWWMINVDAKE